VGKEVIFDIALFAKYTSDRERSRMTIKLTNGIFKVNEDEKGSSWIYTAYISKIFFL
jgi:hypothetical protein